MKLFESLTSALPLAHRRGRGQPLGELAMSEALPSFWAV
jgi:hypothetical protein